MVNYTDSEYNDLIRRLLDVSIPEYQTIKWEKTGGWEIRCYCKLGEEESLVNLIIALDAKIRELLKPEEKRMKPTITLKDLTKFNKSLEASTCIKLFRSAKGIYSCEIKLLSKVNEELEMVDKIKSIKDMLMGLVTRTKQE